MKAIYFGVENIESFINMYLDKGWTVYSVTPCLETHHGCGSWTSGFLIVFNTNGIEL